MDRIKIFQIIIFTAAIFIIARLFYWQFIAQVTSSGEINSAQIIPASRGEIFTNDDFPIVADQEAFLLYAKPHEITKDSQELAKVLAPSLISEKYATSGAAFLPDLQKQKEEEVKQLQTNIFAHLADKNLFWVQLARKLPKDIKEKIQTLDISGLGFEKDKKRFYPEASMAAHLLGFVGLNKFGDDTGYFGLEGYYDQRLKGQPGRLGRDRDPLGFPILVGRYRTVEPKKGDSLKLSIDRTMQFIVEQKLEQAVEKYGAKEGTVIISDPKTGQIMAMATYPNYNPNLYQEYDGSQYKNPAIANTYEPGSVFKLITMASALDMSLVDPNTRCDICSGPRQIAGYEISTWNKKYYPNSTMTEVIQHSDNVGISFVADKLGIDRFYEYILKFGFREKTGIDLQEEADGAIRNKKDWKGIDLVTSAFGQGIAVTPIQMVQAVQAIANRGVLISPKIVAKIIANSKEEIVKPGEKRQVISAKTAAQITEMMVNAVEKGEAKAFVPKGYKIAGKTGTAQIPLAGHYDPDKTIASFVGFAPANDPKFVMLVLFNQPSASIFGSETAAPTFFEIARELFNYLGISQAND
ncbi:hypothetical protein A3B51_01895 [Candidatus Curtissbacteria bacterium RIFCSPLOWO2_01_FULL_41_18]|uniref:Penicillin-binding protein transpeptidase domain-containing protein n=1 Tax=Candidatus Curtissbacteria bacterium RIFCSPLOWO2_01_FULL_41_18 TaxID=1797727 RepID=A0A1F5HIF6_9BACT|nr:MAG: hypothetical protein A3B51_01895 [Candidatus Curtissbacteria bacterium RIFCSPLOWO2_01_FULL_41_18]